MALQVWLPLNGDTNNYGLKGDIQNFSLNALTQHNDGKIGKCYGDCAIYHLSEDFLPNCWTIALWVKKVAAWNQYNEILTCKNISSFSTSQFYFSIINGAQLNIGINGGSAISGGQYNYTFATNTWYHLAATYDGKNFALYINGNQVKTGTCTTAKPSGHMNLGIGCRCESNSNGTSQAGADANKYINDFRIYDHALSVKEVKEIAKGLVLHYPLNKPLPNLLNGNIHLIDKWTPDGTSRVQHTDGSMKITSTTANGRIYNELSNVWTSGKKYTVTLEARSDTAGTTIDCSRSITDYAPGFTLSTSWQKFSGIINCTTTASGGTLSIRINQNGRTVYIRNVKLEEGEKETSFIPPSNSSLYAAAGYASGTVYDCSGYQNNGTEVGTITGSSDTPRYRSSKYFDGIDSAIQVPYNATVFQTNFTINLWFKKTELGLKNYETLFGGPDGFEMDTRANSSTTLSLYMAFPRGENVFSPFNFNEWYMVTLVNDGTNELYYINGELKKTIEKKSMPTGNYFIGAWRTSSEQNFKGYISDFRIYCTALSADDIKALYDDAGYIDKNGNFHAYEFVEE